MTNVWTAITAPNVSISYPGGYGTSSSALMIPGSTNVPEVWNGVAWVNQSGNNGTLTNSFLSTNSISNCLWFTANNAEYWNGTTWSSVPAPAPGTYFAYQPWGCGSSSVSAIVVTTSKVYTYDGVSWTDVGSSGTGSVHLYGGAGSTGSAMFTVGNSTSTKYWNGAVPLVSGGTRNVYTSAAALAGTGGAGILASGTTSESWSGTTWTSQSNIPSGLSTRPGLGGSASDAIAFSTTKAYIFTTQVLAAPVANFSGTPTSGLDPLTVVFTDLSTNTPTSWDWDYGDGSTHGTTQNPTHIYANAGTYTVTLTATNIYGSDAEAKTAYIVVSESDTGQLAVGDEAVLICNTVGKPILVRR
jgi:PKD repeat protein